MHNMIFFCSHKNRVRWGITVLCHQNDWKYCGLRNRTLTTTVIFLVEIYTIRVLRNYLLHIYSLQVWINPLRKYKFKAYQFEFILWKTKLFLCQYKKDSLNKRYNSMKNAGKTLTWTQGRYLLRAILTNLYLYTLT